MPGILVADAAITAEQQLQYVERRLQSPELIEWLAALSHDQWTGWTRWMMDHWNTTHPGGETFQERWQRQMRTPYAELSESEKGSDRQEAQRVIDLLIGYLNTGLHVKRLAEDRK